MSDHAIRFFAVVSLKSGYAHDFYPEERLQCQREMRSSIIGEYDTYEEATEAVVRALQARWSKAPNKQKEPAA
jgi:hypothetical protein